MRPRRRVFARGRFADLPSWRRTAMKLALRILFARLLTARVALGEIDVKFFDANPLFGEPLFEIRQTIEQDGLGAL